MTWGKWGGFYLYGSCVHDVLLALTCDKCERYTGDGSRIVNASLTKGTR